MTMTEERPARNPKKEPFVLWLTGLPAAGKSTLAQGIVDRLQALGLHPFLLDGDVFRHGIGSDLGFGDDDRVENVRRAGEMVGLLLDAGTIVVVAMISPFREGRERARERVGTGRFVEIFVDTPLAVCEDRDPKGLYRRARSGEIGSVTGIDSAYEPPGNPDMALKTVENTPEELVERVIRHLQENGHL